ncbi:hypothetical protein L1987_81221 [Smallanthus sonchifolius]|uniref:Uncharacterized protein n=1 Tax=Smallanthus sonchifolius TaxID=185202 RepID=A0ACB8YP52_9ASTR|nr:hypothetical protein L1987_81221 [Smallanthus sonchifolius]
MDHMATKVESCNHTQKLEINIVYEPWSIFLLVRVGWGGVGCMVSEKTDLNVAIRYSSSLSLHTYFSNGITKMYHALDEKFVMGTKLAREVLLRQVPSQEFAEKKHLEGFWLVNTNPQFRSHVGLKNEDLGVDRELKNNMIWWGVRRQVMFIGKHKESSKTQSSSSFVQGEEEPKKSCW